MTCAGDLAIPAGKVGIAMIQPIILINGSPDFQTKIACSAVTSSCRKSTTVRTRSRSRALS